MVEHFGRSHVAPFAEGFAHAVEHDDGFIDRVAEYRQNRCEHREREFPLEAGEETHDDDDVVQVGNDRRHRKAPFKAHRHVEHDADDHEQQRHCAIAGEFFADLRADKVDAAQFGFRAFDRVQRFHDLFGEVFVVALALVFQADQDIAGTAEILHLRVGITAREERLPQGFERDGFGIADFNQRAAGEFDRQMQAAKTEKEHGGDEGDQRDDVEYRRVAHEGDVFFDAEKFHGASLLILCLLPVPSGACQLIVS